MSDGEVDRRNSLPRQLLDKIKQKLSFEDKNVPALPPPPPPKYKLIHYSMEDNVAFLQWLFVLADQEFDDVDIKTKEEWNESDYPDKSPFGQVPLLEIEGKEQVCSSLAIARYLAREFGFTNGITPLEDAKVDMIVGSIDENKRPVEVAQQIDDESKREGLLKKYRDEQLPEFLAKLELYLEKNGGSFLKGLKGPMMNGHISTGEVKDKIEETAKDAKDKIEKTAKDAKDKIDEKKKGGKEKVEETTEDVKEKIEETTENVEEKVEDITDGVPNVVDLVFVNFTQGLEKIQASPEWEKFPRLSALKGKVESNPKINEWREKKLKAEEEARKEIEESQKKKK